MIDFEVPVRRAFSYDNDICSLLTYGLYPSFTAHNWHVATAAVVKRP